MRDKILKILRLYGSSPTSFQILKSKFNYFVSKNNCIGYVDTGRAWVAAGDPVCKTNNKENLINKFIETASHNGRRALFFGTTKSNSTTHSSTKEIYIGDTAILHALEWKKELETSKTMKEQLRRAQAKGVVITQLTQNDLSEVLCTKKCELLIKDWLEAKTMAPMGFMVSVEPFIFTEECLYFVAQQNGNIVGLLVAIPIYVKNGWLIEHIIRSPYAPNGTSELLLHEAMISIADKNQDYVSLGLTPLYGQVSRALTFIKNVTNDFYNFRGIRKFKEKLPTVKFEPSYILYPAKQNIILNFYDVACAFIPQGFIRFSFNTLIRLPALLYGIFVLTTTIWTILLAQMDTYLWFPSTTVHIGWVLFDIGLIYIFWRLYQKFSHALLVFLASIITIDIILTGIQVYTFNFTKEYTPIQYTVMSFGILAPLLTVIILWQKIIKGLQLKRHTPRQSAFLPTSSPAIFSSAPPNHSHP